MIRLGRIIAQFTPHLKQLFRAAIPRLQLLIGERPCGRNAFQMRHFRKILAAIADQHRAKEFGVAADIVVVAGIEWRTAGLVPELLRAKEALLENGARVAVFRPVREMLPASRMRMSAPDTARPAAIVAPPIPDPMMTISGCPPKAVTPYFSCGIHMAVRAPICMLSVLVSV